MKNTKIDINEIMSIIPHRYPILLVDKVIELQLNKSIVGIKNVTMNEPQFTGHFPSNPVMPGVLIIESMAQLAAVLVAKSVPAFDNKEVLLLSIENSKFRKIVIPGDSLVIHAEILQNRGSVWKFRAYAEVDGIITTESAFTAMVKENNKIS